MLIKYTAITVVDRIIANKNRLERDYHIVVQRHENVQKKTCPPNQGQGHSKVIYTSRRYKVF